MMASAEDISTKDVPPLTNGGPAKVVRGKRQGLLGALAVGAIAGVVGYGNSS